VLHWLQRLMGSKPEPGSGGLGERLAAEWLQRERRFKLLARNWRSPRDRRDEIDLVCEDGDVVVFVEVKARAAGALVSGYHAVTARKKRVLRRAIRSYVAQLRQKPRTFRFDVVEIGLPDAEGRPPQILHFENVALFSKYYRG
jgi:putative endonuclease